MDHERAQRSEGAMKKEPLFWIAVGSFLGVVGLPILMLFVEAVMALVLAVDPKGSSTQGITSALIVGLPLTFCLVLFSDVTGRVKWAIAKIDRPSVRIVILVASAVLVAFFRVAMHIEGLDLLTFHKTETSEAVRDEINEIAFIVAVAAPIVMGAFLLGLRKGRAPSRVAWVMVGAFVSIVGFEVGAFMWNAALFAGATMKLGPSAVSALVWIVTVASPPVCVAFAYVWITRSRVPRFGLPLLAGLCVAGVAAWVSMPHVHTLARGLLDGRSYETANDARALAGIIAGAMMPVAAGALVLRLRHFASAASASPSM
jgi:hypothetical protein